MAQTFPQKFVKIKFDNRIKLQEFLKFRRFSLQIPKSSNRNNNFGIDKWYNNRFSALFLQIMDFVFEFLVVWIRMWRLEYSSQCLDH
jgi:hypothetical protein